VRRHDDDGQRRPGVPDLLEQLETRLTGHADVCYQHIRGLAAKSVQRRLRGFECTRRHTAVTQGSFQHPANGGIVVDEPDAQSLAVHEDSPSGKSNVKMVRLGSLTNSMIPPLRVTSS
jgi:hypothetical protein